MNIEILNFSEILPVYLEDRMSAVVADNKYWTGSRGQRILLLYVEN